MKIFDVWKINIKYCLPWRAIDKYMIIQSLITRSTIGTYVSLIKLFVRIKNYITVWFLRKTHMTLNILCMFQNNEYVYKKKKRIK